MTWVIGITGPSGSGKSTLARALLERLAPRPATLVVQDDYYRDLGHLTLAERLAIDFDDPAAVELELLAAHLAELRAGRSVAGPVYDFATHTRVPGRSKPVEPGGVIVVEGLLLAAERAVRRQLHRLVYVETPRDACLDRRVARDVKERGRTRESVEAQWRRTVEPAARRHIEPVAGEADLVVSGTGAVADSVDSIIELMRRDGVLA